MLQAQAHTPRVSSAAAQDIPVPAVQALWGWVQLHCLWDTRGWKLNILSPYDSEHTMTSKISLPFFEDYTQILNTYSQALRFGQNFSCLQKPGPVVSVHVAYNSPCSKLIHLDYEVIEEIKG